MKKEYIKPEITMEIVMLESICAVSDNRESMDNNEIPGDQDAFNANDRRGGSWGNLWD